MFGDYEAQRHWMEITYNLPLSHWYYTCSLIIHCCCFLRFLRIKCDWIIHRIFHSACFCVCISFICCHMWMSCVELFWELLVNIMPYGILCQTSYVRCMHDIACVGTSMAQTMTYSTGGLIILRWLHTTAGCLVPCSCIIYYRFFVISEMHTYMHHYNSYFLAELGWADCKK